MHNHHNAKQRQDINVKLVVQHHNTSANYCCYKKITFAQWSDSED